MTNVQQPIHQREQDLYQLLRALYNSALHENDKERLELHRKVAVELKQLIDKATNVDSTINSDISLNLLLFIELKRDGEVEAEKYSKDVARDLDILGGTA